MSDTTAKRRREKYSKLICLGCRARRIRCILPDTDITPSSVPQSEDNACQRCRQNGLDCIVDYTTLGRPAQKRNRVFDQVASQSQITEPSDVVQRSNDDFEESVTQNIDDFLLSHPERQNDGAHVRPTKPSKSEMAEAMTSPTHLLTALLTRDKGFASAIGSQPQVTLSILEVIDDRTTVALDEHLVWHKLHYPDIPTLSALRVEIKAMEPGQYERPSAVFLLTLLIDIALDVPSNRLAPYRYLQAAVRALLYHGGQQLMFSLARCRNTVLALALAFEYRPLTLTSSQGAAAHSLKAIPHIVMARYIASELGYPQSAARLTEKLQDFSADGDDLKILMFDCVRWVSLNLAEEALTGPFNVWQRQRDPYVHDCLDALHNAVLLNRMPPDLILVYSSLTTWTQMYAYVKEAMVNWKDLSRLENIITHHNSFCETQGEVLERLLDQNVRDNDTVQAISHEMASQRHLSQTLVTGCALFFAVMCGAYAQTRVAAIQHEQAMEIGDNIIKQLQAHDEQDPTRPSHRKFLETFGRSRSDELEKVLSNFITAVDTLTINGVAYIGETRDLCSSILYVCKDMVEGNAARLKGWGGLDDRVDVQMILFHECARRLESMSATAGTEEALAKGCILTATAKLIRSLHKILQGFKKSMMAAQRRSASESTKSNPTPPSAPSEASIGGELASTMTGSTERDSLLTDDLFADWENWPQFDAFDFSDLFGNVFDFDQSVEL